MIIPKIMKTLILVSLALISTLMYGQSVSRILSVEYNVEQISGEFVDPLASESQSYVVLDSVLLNDPAMQNDPMVIESKTEALLHQNDINGSVDVIVLLSDINGVSKVHYKIGRTQSGNEIGEGFISLDDEQGNEKVSYLKVMNQIVLNFGVHNNIGNLYGEFFIERGAGDISSVVVKELHL